MLSFLIDPSHNGLHGAAVVCQLEETLLEKIAGIPGLYLGGNEVRLEKRCQERGRVEHSRARLYESFMHNLRGCRYLCG